MRLSLLIEGGVVQAERYSDHARRVEYSLTKSGLELATVLMALTSWGDRWHPPEGGPPIRFRHKEHRCDPTIVCATCHERIDASDVSFRPGPGGRVAPGTKLIAERVMAAAKR